MLDVGGRWGPGRSDRWRRYRAEEAGEDLRLFYVAADPGPVPGGDLVGAVAQHADLGAAAVLLYRSVGEPRPSHPGRLRTTCRRPVQRARGLGTQVAAARRSCERPIRPPGTRRRPRHRAALAARSFDRVLDTAWRRTSYSVADRGRPRARPAVAGVGSEPEPGKEDDESALPGRARRTRRRLPPPGRQRRRRAVADGATCRCGADFGTVVHAVLEVVDPPAGDLAAELRRGRPGRLARLPAGDRSPPTSWPQALRRPSRPRSVRWPATGRCPTSPPADRLAELGFELPLAGGDRPRRADVRLDDLVAVLRRHLPPTIRWPAYADALADPALADQPCAAT